NTELPKDIEEPKVQPAVNTVDLGESLKADVLIVHPGSVAAHIKERKCKTRGGSSRPPMKRKLAFESSSSRAAVVDNVVNKRACEFLQVIEKMSDEADVIKAKERSREEEYEELRVKCEAAMKEFDQNPAVLALREKISSLTADVKEHKGNLDRMMLGSQKWTGYQVTLSNLELKVGSLEAEKARLEAVEASLRRVVEELKQDRRDVVSKVIPYAAMDLVHSDELGRLIGKLVSSAITYTRCRAYVQFVADAAAPIEALLSKKPPMLQKPTPSRTQMPVPSSQKATPSFVPSLNPMSPSADLVKPSPSLLE
ncbi:hypothetical protein Tco_0830133, partial [Tanacetum coccineum]